MDLIYPGGLVHNSRYMITDQFWQLARFSRDTNDRLAIVYASTLIVSHKTY